MERIGAIGKSHCLFFICLLYKKSKEEHFPFDWSLNEERKSKYANLSIVRFLRD